MLVTLARESHAQGHAVFVCVTRQSGPLRAELSDEIPVYVLNRSWSLDPKGFWRFLEVLRLCQPEIVQVHGRSTAKFIAAAKRMSGFDAAVVFHDHYGGVYVDQSTPLWLRAGGHRLFSAYVGVCEKLRQWAIRSGFPEEVCHTIPNCLPSDEPIPFRGGQQNLRERFKVPGQCRLGICVAGIRPEKGIYELIEACRQIHGQVRYKIVVVGGARDKRYGERCIAKVQEEQLGDVIEFAGEIPGIGGMLGETDFGVVASIFESGPLALLEFMRAGIPFVSTAVGGVAEMAQQAGLEEFVPPGDAEALADAIQRVIRLSEEERERRKRAGRELFSKVFEVSQVIQSWQKVYAACLARGGK